MIDIWWISAAAMSSSDPTLHFARFSTMHRKRSSQMLASQPSKGTSQPDRLPVPPARTLRLESPMSRSPSDLKELQQFDFGFPKEHSAHTAEPLFQDTFYLTSEDEPSPIAPHAAFRAMRAIERLSGTTTPISRRVSEDQSAVDSDYDDVTVETFTATKVTYFKHGKPRKIETIIAKPDSMSRNSSISTRETEPSSPSEAPSKLSTPASSISEYQGYSPISTSRYSTIPETDNKPFRKLHRRTQTIALDKIEERPRTMQQQEPPRPSLVQREGSRFHKSDLRISTPEGNLAATQSGSPTTPSLKRTKKSMFLRR